MKLSENIAPCVEETNYDSFVHLLIFPNSPELKNKYETAAANHNYKIMRQSEFYDSGFDLFVPPSGQRFENSYMVSIDFGVKCCAILYKKNSSGEYEGKYSPFYTYARSSISKSVMRLANNQGIIDAGYRGNIIGKFDLIYQQGEFADVSDYDRILQICGPSLEPIFVTVVDRLEGLGPQTVRGEGSFGSTGK